MSNTIANCSAVNLKSSVIILSNVMTSQAEIAPYSSIQVRFSGKGVIGCHWGVWNVSRDTLC
jgi:hypothetical protein